MYFVVYEDGDSKELTQMDVFRILDEDELSDSEDESDGESEVDTVPACATKRKVPRTFGVVGTRFNSCKKTKSKEFDLLVLMLYKKQEVRVEENNTVENPD